MAFSNLDFKTDQPPIITYPEFLTKPAKPPPLITASGLLNSLGIVAGLSTFVYGATKYLVSPMVDSLTESRVEFHEIANKNLSQLVEKLEHAVSEIPESYHAAGRKAALASSTYATGEYTDAADDNASSYDDPTELFHRDVGVQTSPPSTPGGLSYPTAGTAGAATKHSSAVATQQQADKLGRLITSISDLSADLASQADGFGEAKSALDDFGHDLHAMTYPPESFGVGSSYLYGAARSEPEDEIKKVKNNIRSVKGVLLSTRSFAAPTR
ncbi:putative peroxin 14 17 [Diaporthe ampelina]|uniref:Putative peroxin 14 17 n=1 Tax=Diaporthe ampelina TaxID=1214573 RepID=A0A0G2HRD9_9PEZI|nr:putative peroxin 14 17 [Diaporthe ampelina]